MNVNLTLIIDWVLCTKSLIRMNKSFEMFQDIILLITEKYAILAPIHCQ